MIKLSPPTAALSDSAKAKEDEANASKEPVIAIIKVCGCCCLPICNVMISLGILKHLCLARFTLCQNVQEKKKRCFMVPS